MSCARARPFPRASARPLGALETSLGDQARVQREEGDERIRTAVPGKRAASRGFVRRPASRRARRLGSRRLEPLLFANTATGYCLFNMARLRRSRTFRVWLVDSAEILRAAYNSAVLPAVGETILVEKMQLDAEGAWKRTKTKPVPARVTRVSGGFITAEIDNDA